jgi:hypothetical protein
MATRAASSGDDVWAQTEADIFFIGAGFLIVGVLGWLLYDKISQAAENATVATREQVSPSVNPFGTLENPYAVAYPDQPESDVGYQ